MGVRPPLITDPKPSVLMDPRQRPFDRPPRLSQAALVVDPLLGQDRLDSHLLQPLAVRFGVVGQIPLQGPGLLLGMTDLTRHGRDLVEQRGHLGDVIGVGRRHTRGQGDAVGISDHVVLAAGLGPVYDRLT